MGDRQDIHKNYSKGDQQVAKIREKRCREKHVFGGERVTIAYVINYNGIKLRICHFQNGA